MALNVLTEAQKQYESLSDRLNKLDSFVGAVDPTAGLKPPTFEGRPSGYNPISTVSNARDTSLTLGRTRSDMAAEQGNALDRLVKLQPAATQDTLSTKDRLSLEMQAEEKGLQIYQKEDGTLGVKKKGAGSEKAPDLKDQIRSLPTVGERNAAVAVKDILDVIDTAIKKSEKTSTGPWSTVKAKFSKLTTPNRTAQLQKDLSEILRTIRKESTGVAFSPQEIKALEEEIPSIMQQEGNVSDSLNRLKGRMLQKLNNLGLDITDSMNIKTEEEDKDPLGLGINQ